LLDAEDRPGARALDGEVELATSQAGTGDDLLGELVIERRWRSCGAAPCTEAGRSCQRHSWHGQEPSSHPSQRCRLGRLGRAREEEREFPMTHDGGGVAFIETK
jgi:hypothetical protein